MKVLVACEFSGIVRDAFIKRGHDAVSCDILPTESAGPHIKKDVLNVLNDGWDMMIGHPPCTYISYAGTHVWNNPGRCEKRLQALEFFRLLWEAPIEKICLENPKSCASPTIAKYSQEIQPYYFGDRHFKTIWLWLKNLPPLLHFDEPTLFDQKTHTKCPEPTKIESSGKKRYFTDGMARSGKERAKFWPGIAEAMADQWG
tara:strand:+ start:191 stop:793 length:603 start_codon:yes stop_codon:yes gene_type:complete